MKITPNPSSFRIPQKPEPNTVKQDTVMKNKATSNQQVDKYIPSEKEQSVTYEKPAYKADTQTIDRLKAESEKAYEQLANLVRELLQRQGMTFKEVASGEKELVVDEQARAEAQLAIGEGGEQSPEKVSDRIVEFANAVSGGDKSKFELLKNAIKEGFNAAKKALGGTLPEISQKTYDLVMEKLNKWNEEE